MLQRVLETEVMDTVEEAVDYDSMDHGEVNWIFVADLRAAGLTADEGEILDLGTGTALIPIELCRQVPSAQVLAVDLSEQMLAVGRKNVEKAGLADRLRLELVDAKRLPYREGQFATVISNSIVHHLSDPSTAINEAWRVTAGGGLIFFRDLFRPDSETAVCRLVETYAAGANPHQQRMLADSFLAALTVDEIRKLIIPLGVPAESVSASSDRHWTWTVRKNII